ncbi:MAG: histidine phosphatase family protein [Saprospiraceae bacterium]|nr:histidine phosphatase family protein [Saprospiraceae bacterium]
MKKLIYIVRHGETDLNRKGIVQGSGVDSSLNELGRQQARAFYEFYKEIPFEAVLTSKLRRTHETMQYFIETGLPWEQFSEINEMNWGHHEGKLSTPEMHEEYKLVKEAWGRGDYSAKLDGGESAAALGARLSDFIEHLRQRTEQYLLVCSHGRAMCALVTLLQNLPLKEMNRFIHHNTGLWKTHYDGMIFQFELENDIQHLEAILNVKS